MPPRKQLTEDEIKEIQKQEDQSKNNQLSRIESIVQNIQSDKSDVKLQGADHKQEDQSNNQLGRIESMLQNIQSDKSFVKPQDSAIENNDFLLDNNLLLAVYRRVKDINQRVQHVQEILEQAQDEVESVASDIENVASDVENIDEKIEDVEIDTNTIADIFQDMYKNIKTAGQLVYYGSIVAGGIGIIAYTLKYVHRNKTDEFDFDSKPVKPVINTQHIESFDIPTKKPDLFSM